MPYVENIQYAKRNDVFTNDEEGNVTVSLPEVVVNDTEPARIDAGGKEEEREGWGNKLEFILAIVGFAVGLGNVWRFPYLAQKNGGGAFLIPYFISLFATGLPVFFLELGIGQRFRKGPLHVWNKLCPQMTGLGLSSVVCTFLVCTYYNMVVAWTFYYFFISFQKTLPYGKCPIVGGNSSNPIYLQECVNASATTYYWYHTALEATDSINESGGLNWKLCLCLLLAWTIVYAITCRGTETMGKVVYFTGIFPYLVLFIFLIRALLLEGAGDGIKHMFTPQFSRLKSAEVWLDAASQIFFSLAISFGGMISMASYNPIHNNIKRDAIMVGVINCSTSILAGFVVFGILGYKATNKYNHCIRSHQHLVGPNVTPIHCDKQKFLNEVAQGPGLTFIAITEALSTMSLPQLWSGLFFLMILTLGIGTMLGQFDPVRTTVIDLELIPLRKEYTTLILCVISYFCGLLFCQRSGVYWLQMFDSFAANMGLLSIGFCEVIVVGYVYGVEKFSDDIEFMIGTRPSRYWTITWKYCTPVLTLAIMIASVIELIWKGMAYDAYNSLQAKVVPITYAGWSLVVCFLLMLSSPIFLPLTPLLMKFNLFRITGIKDFELKNDLSIKKTVSTTTLEKSAVEDGSVSSSVFEEEIKTDL